MNFVGLRAGCGLVVVTIPKSDASPIADKGSIAMVFSDGFLVRSLLSEVCAGLGSSSLVKPSPKSRSRSFCAANLAPMLGPLSGGREMLAWGEMICGGGRWGRGVWVVAGG